MRIFTGKIVTLSEEGKNVAGKIIVLKAKISDEFGLFLLQSIT